MDIFWYTPPVIHKQTHTDEEKDSSGNETPFDGYG